MGEQTVKTEASASKDVVEESKEKVEEKAEEVASSVANKIATAVEKVAEKVEEAVSAETEKVSFNGTVEVDKTVYYKFSIDGTDIEKRFKQINALNNAVAAFYKDSEEDISLLSLPSKKGKIFHTETFVQERAEALKVYFTELFALPRINDCQEVKDFLEGGEKEDSVASL